VFRLIWNRCPAYKKYGNKPNNALQTYVLYGSLVSKSGGVKIMLLWRLVKARVGKTCAMVGENGCDEVEKESRKDMFLPLFAD
jgi:hypothetical protein